MRRTAFPRLKWPLGCLAVSLGVALAASGAFLFDRLDTSDGVTDVRLEQRVQDALGCCRQDPNDSVRYEVTVDLDEAGLRDRVRTVDGWDQIVILASHDAGKLVSEDPAFTSWWLRRRLGGIAADTSSTRHRVFVIREQAIVGSFRFDDTEALRSAVVTRAP